MSDKFDLEAATIALKAAQVADEYGDRLDAARWVWGYGNKALAEIARLRNKWVSVEDSPPILPDDSRGEYFIVCNPGEESMLAWYSSLWRKPARWYNPLTFDTTEITPPTYYMPMPPSPEAK